jgi:hypothetical protein
VDITRYLHVPIPKQTSLQLIRSGHLYLLTDNDYHTSTMLTIETNIRCYMANLNEKKRYTNYVFLFYVPAEPLKPSTTYSTPASVT